MPLSDGELRARVCYTRQAAVRVRRAHADAWMVCEEARTANVQDLARSVVALSMEVLGLLSELERDAIEQSALVQNGRVS